jgi:hypothetical protein
VRIEGAPVHTMRHTFATAHVRPAPCALTASATS